MEKHLLERRLNQCLGFSVYGTGVSVLGYRPIPNGLCRITLWMTFFFIPILPVTSRVVRFFKIQDESSSHVLLRDRFGFEIIGLARLPLTSILRTYIKGWSLAFFALIPVVICVRFGQIYWPNGGSPGWFVFLTVSSVIWPIFMLGLLNHRKNQIYEDLNSK